MRKTIVIVFFCFSSLAVSQMASAEQTIRISGNNLLPFTGVDLRDNGFFAELVSASFRKEGRDVSFEFYSWGRALDYARSGKVDGIMTIYWSKDRTQFLSYSNSVYKDNQEFISLKKSQVRYNGQPKSLRNFKIGVLFKTLEAGELRALGLNIYEVYEIPKLVESLFFNRIDMILVSNDVFTYQCNKQLLPIKTSTVLKPPYKIFDMHVAFSKKRSNYESLTSTFDKGLKKIKADGTYRKILIKHGVNSSGN